MVVIDEVQLFPGREIQTWLAYAYDWLDNFTFLLTGSQVGLIDRIIEGSALGGRAKKVITMNTLSYQKSCAFLHEGFSQAGIKPEKGEVEETVELLDGLIGWLTLYGHYRMDHDRKTAVEKTIDDGKEIIKEELNFLLTRERHPDATLKTLKGISLGLEEWSDIYHYFSGYTNVPKSTFSRIMSRLVDYSFIRKENNKFQIIDPILKHLLSFVPKK